MYIFNHHGTFSNIICISFVQESVEDDAQPSASDESDEADQIPDLIETDKDEVKPPSPKKESVAANTRKRKPRKD